MRPFIATGGGCFSLATIPTASALPMSCTVALALADSYIATGNVFRGLGANQQAVYWYGKASGLIVASCS
jgi:hypothetical protein